MQANQKVGRWTLLREVADQWHCRCDCGVTRWVFTHNLGEGKTKSCGCLRTEAHQRAMRLSFPEVTLGLR